jgi:hypothetical protein
MKQSTIKAMLILAALRASARRDPRKFRVGAVGFAHRHSSKPILASNLPVQGCARAPRSHAEARLAHKVARGTTVFVARVNPRGDWALAKPCARCTALLWARKIERVFYTIGPSNYGVLYREER